MVLFTGSTVEEAIQKGLKELGIPRMKTHIKVVSKEKKGFLGLFGKKPAQVDIEAIKKIEEEGQGVSDEIKAEILKNEKHASTILEETGHIAILNELQTGDAGAEDPAECKDFVSMSESVESQSLEDLGLKVEPSYDIEQVAAEVANYVQTIVDDMDVEGTISSDYNRRTINLQIDTNEPGRIIGYHGKVLKALQLLAQNYLYNRYSRTFYITINVNDYVEHRAEVLQTYAQKLATRVLEEGRSQQTDPMSNSERKIIHRIISRMDGVTSYSEGDEPNRYVVVDTE